MNRFLAIAVMMGQFMAWPHQAKAEGLPPTCVLSNLHPIPETHTIPPYTLTAIKMADSGTTIMRAVIGPSGTPIDISVVDSSGFADLDAAAVDWTKRTWRWAPLAAECPKIETRLMVKW